MFVVIGLLAAALRLGCSVGSLGLHRFVVLFDCSYPVRLCGLICLGGFGCAYFVLVVAGCVCF